MPVMLGKRTCKTVMVVFAFLLCVQYFLFLPVIEETSRLTSNNSVEDLRNGENQRQFHLDLNRTSYYPFSNATDDRCKKHSVSYLVPHSLDSLVGLVSYPGSGNTWTRYLIEGVTGVFTGGLVEEHGLAEHMWGSRERLSMGTTFVTKIHGRAGDLSPFLPANRSISAAILLLRCPLDAIRAYSHMMNARSHTGKAPDAHFTSEIFQTFAQKEMLKWGDLVISWLKQEEERGLDLLVVHYERLRADLTSELVRLASFLRVPPREDRIGCTVGNSVGHYRREPDTFKTVFPFVKEEVMAAFETQVCRVKEALKKRRNDTEAGLLPLDLYERSLRDKYVMTSRVNNMLQSLCN